MAEIYHNSSRSEFLPDPPVTDPTNLLTAIDALRGVIQLQGRGGMQHKPATIFERIVAPLSEMLPFEMIAFVLFGDDQIDISLEFAHPKEARASAEARIAALIDRGAFARALRKGQSLLVCASEADSTLDHLLCPLVTEDGIRGMFCGALSPEAKPDEDVLSLIEIAISSLSVAIDNSLFYDRIRSRTRILEKQEEVLQVSFENLRSIMNGAIRTIATIAELRDPYTSGHQERVSRLGGAIAQILGLPEEEVEGIRVAGALHDVGKMQVPTEILCKPGKVTEIEMMMLRTHAHAGYEILSGITFPWPVAEIVRQHHERWNGSGYPRGLCDDEILIEARILAVADVVEAMASHRPYRPALGIDKALAEIRHGKEAIYDPEVVDACLQVFEEGLIELS